MTTVITGKSAIELYRIRVLRSGLALEIAGMHRRGRSCYTILKQELGLKGNRESVLKQVDEILGR